MRRMIFAVLLVVAATSWSPIAATTYTYTKHYPPGADCSGTPNVVISTADECSSDSCYTDDYNDTVTAVCNSDYLEPMKKIFGTSLYIIQVIYSDTVCTDFLYTIGYRVTGTCEPGYYEPDTIKYFTYYIATLADDGSATIEFFTTSDCSSSSSASSSSSSGYYDIVPVSAAKSVLESSVCVAVDYNSYMYAGAYYYEWFSSNSSDDDGGLSTGAIVGIVCGCVVVLLLVVGGVLLYRRRAKGKRGAQWTATLPSGDLTSLEAAMSGQSGLWNDDVITAKRVPRDKVKVKKLISRGAYGEVYNGVFNGQQVAVKMLLPSTRGNLQHVTDFLTEAKMTASMDHPHIVTFVGVAWDSLSDLCVVLEFMDGGDLRIMLNQYEATKHPVGVDREKAIIALHVCHALTYLHSLMPPVIHRDLKSRNILLNQSKEAKLTDFGISRERLDQTMTAGVGTSLWMAPEVMLGEKYDVKADMFSFGVVLSELDVHTLPYAQAKQRSLDTNGRKMADTTLLQKITAGEVRVEFSEASPRPLVELGYDCVALEPGNRPSAAEALYRIQVILSQELA